MGRPPRARNPKTPRAADLQKIDSTNIDSALEHRWARCIDELPREPLTEKSAEQVESELLQVADMAMIARIGKMPAVPGKRFEFRKREFNWLRQEYYSEGMLSSGLSVKIGDELIPHGLLLTFDNMCNIVQPILSAVEMDVPKFWAMLYVSLKRRIDDNVKRKQFRRNAPSLGVGEQTKMVGMKVEPSIIDIFDQASRALGISRSEWIKQVALRAARKQGLEIPDGYLLQFGVLDD